MHRSSLAALVLLAFASPAQAIVALDPTALLSVSSGTSGGNDFALGLDSPGDGEAITPDGRYVAFVDASSNLAAPGNSAGNFNVFWRDTQTGQTRLVSVNGAGTDAANFGATQPDISDDGRYVTFTSPSTNVLPGTTIPGGLPNVYLRDMATGTTTLISRDTASATTAGTERSLDASISGNGQRIAFASRSTNLETPAGQVPPVGALAWRTYVRDLAAGTTTLVSVAATGAAPASGQSSGGVITPDGRYVAFSSDSQNLVAGYANPHNGADQVYRRDLQAGTTVLASPAVDGPTVGAIDTNGFRLTMSSDGRYIAFEGDGDDLVGTDDLNQTSDVFLRDVTAATTTLVSGTDATHTGDAESSVPRISADGRYVMFYSDATGLVPGDANGHADLVRWDRTTGARAVVNAAAGTSHPSSGGTHVTFSGQGITGGALSADGSRAAFSTDDTDLVPGYTGSGDQVYLRDFAAGTTQLVSSGASATTGANGDSLKAWMSADGSRITWTSVATDLIGAFGNLNGAQDDFFTRAETPAAAPDPGPPAPGGGSSGGTAPEAAGAADPPAAPAAGASAPMSPAPAPGPGDDPDPDPSPRTTTTATTVRPHGVTRRGTPGHDVLVGTRFADRLLGRAGDDVLTGRAGRDVLRGGPGDDLIKAADGSRDTVDCGAGHHDRAIVDRIDVVAGCERVTIARG